MFGEKMYLKEIPWETRNLSMPSFELLGNTFSKESAQDILKKKMKTTDTEYFIQLKIESWNIDNLHLAEDLGFRFIEMTINPWLTLDTKNDLILSSFSKNPQNFVPSEFNIVHLNKHRQPVTRMNVSLKREIIENSRKVFTTDRFHQDPYCDNSKADKRIGLWLEKDLLIDEHNMCTSLQYKENLIGYIIWRDNKFIIGGIAEEFIGKGFAKTLYLQSILDVAQGGHKEIYTNISLNNTPVLNLYSKLGFSFRNPMFLLHYWSQSRSSDLKSSN